jgi:exosortase/archaeosortase family protein
MKPKAGTSSRIPLFLKDKISLFYLLAFFPLLLILYYNVWSLVIALYGFLFLVLKNQKLRSIKEATALSRILGLAAIIGSFFLQNALRLAVPTAAFYGGANYFIFLFGLFLVFFELSGLKEAFTPLFFIAAATSSYVVASWLKPYFSPHLYDIASPIVNILRMLGVNATLNNLGSIPLISLRSLSGNIVRAYFVYECIGVFSTLVFSIILVVVLIEDPSGWRAKLLASAIGVLGTFALNIVRITIILLTDYFYGAEAGATVHYIIGYALFSAWLAFFLFIYSKRKAVHAKIKSFAHRSDLQKHG